MSAVVGPNGSGKSNVFDALIFVFGFNAKKLRQAKATDLIHNSTAYPNLQHTRVSVCFAEVVDLPGGGSRVVEGSQLEVARIVKKDSSATGSSTFKLNGKTAKKEEVVTALKAKGIDLDHNRFLILQGEVEAIAMMKPKVSARAILSGATLSRHSSDARPAHHPRRRPRTTRACSSTSRTSSARTG
jgi:structural maintenance of chromosome 4